MNILRFDLTALVCALALAVGAAHAVSINDTPVGWASQSGGTTGGAGGTVVVATTLAQLQSYASSSTKYIIYLSGTVGTDVSGTLKPESSSEISLVTVNSNKTIFGLPGSRLIGRIKLGSVSNVILRNLTLQGPGAVDVEGADGITIDNSTHVWIDHCDIFDGQDGNMDIVNGSNYITVTYTKFSYTSKSRTTTGSDGKKAHRYSNLIGNSETKTSDRTKLKVTFQYSWWATGVKERMPRVRFGQVHVVNNLFNSDLSSTCVRAGQEADLLIEGNAFIGVKNPIDLYNTESGYVVTERNNHFSGTSGTQAGTGTAFTPPYTNVTVAAPTSVQATVTGTLGAGATLCDVRLSNCGSVVSSSSVKVSSSSVAPSSSSVASSSSSAPSSSSIHSSSSVASSSSATPSNYSAALIIEGESYCTADGELETKNGGYHADAYLNLDNSVGSQATWSVIAPSAGSFTLEILFANGTTAERPMQVLVNSTEQVASLAFPTTGTWTTWQTLTTPLQLVQGYNTISLVSLAAAGGPNIDALGFSDTGLSDPGCVIPEPGTTDPSRVLNPAAKYLQNTRAQCQRTGNAIGIFAPGQEGRFSPSGRRLR